MSPRLFHLVLASGACAASALAFAQTSTPVIVENADRSIVAGTINGNPTINYYQSLDPLDRRFASSITLMVQETFGAVDNARQGFGAALFNADDPNFHVSGRGIGRFILFAGDSTGVEVALGPKAQTCEFGDGNVVGGLFVEVQIEGQFARIHVETLEREQSVLRAVCEGLSKRTDSEVNPDESPTNFDLIANSEDSFAVLSLEPGANSGTSYEEQLVGGYWLNFDKGLELNTPNGLAELLGVARMRQVNASITRTGRADTTLAFPRKPSPGSFSDSATRLYGDRLQGLQLRWNKFLGQSSIGLGDKAYPVMTGQRVASVIPRIHISDLRRGDYDVVMRPTVDYARDIACLAAVFAVGNGYASPSELPFFRRCEV